MNAAFLESQWVYKLRPQSVAGVMSTTTRAGKEIYQKFIVPRSLPVSHFFTQRVTLAAHHHLNRGRASCMNSSSISVSYRFLYHPSMLFLMPVYYNLFVANGACFFILHIFEFLHWIFIHRLGVFTTPSRFRKSFWYLLLEKVLENIILTLWKAIRLLFLCFLLLFVLYQH